MPPARTRGHRSLPAIALLASLCALPLHAFTLERGNGPEPSTLDAHRCPEVACANILRDLYTGLVVEAADGTIVPGIAERWDTSADGLRWTFHLRDGLRWSNGEPLDAPQVVASFRRAFAPATAAPHASLFEGVVNALAVQRGERAPDELGITAPGPLTVEFRLQRPLPLTALLVLPIALPVHLPSVERWGAAHTRPGRLVSNGPYVLQEWLPQAHVRLVADPQHAPAAIGSVRFHVTEDAAAELKRYQAGDLHMTETLPPVPLAHLRARFGDALRLSPYLGSFWFGCNLQRGPLADAPSLRAALSLAIDRELLTRAITGLGEQPAWGVVPPGIPGYPVAVPEWAAWSQAQRDARARALYAQAGYSAHHPLRIEIRYNTSTPHRRLALAVAAMWREKLGVHAVLRNEEWKVFVQNRRQRVITEVFRGGWIGDVADPLNFLAGFGGDDALNWTGYRSAPFAALLQQARDAASPALRSTLLADAERMLQRDHAVIPLYHYSSRHLVDPRLDGWLPNPLDRHSTRWLRWNDPAAVAR